MILNSMVPLYLSEVITVLPKISYSLGRNNETLLKQISMRCKTFGDLAFSAAAPKVWNSLPETIRNSEHIET